MIEIVADLVRALWLRVLTVLRPGAAWRRLDEEVRFHVDMEAERLRREGHAPREARRLALIRFGGIARFEERTREARARSYGRI